MSRIHIQLRHEAYLIQHELQIILKCSRKLAACSIVVAKKGGHESSCIFAVY